MYVSTCNTCVINGVYVHVPSVPSGTRADIKIVLEAEIKWLRGIGRRWWQGGPFAPFPWKDYWSSFPSFSSFLFSFSILRSLSSLGIPSSCEPRCFIDLRCLPLWGSAVLEGSSLPHITIFIDISGQGFLKANCFALDFRYFIEIRFERFDRRRIAFTYTYPIDPIIVSKENIFQRCYKSLIFFFANECKLRPRNITHD